jgi:5-amino-6-(5-phosphoribosylamino)uracil reductase
MSLDGCLDDTTDQRLVLSGPADLDRVDAERAGCDAIVVGAETVRRDDPRLEVRSPARRAARVAAGRPPSPLRVVLTRGGGLDPGARLFGGGATPLVYCASPGLDRARERLGAAATVADAGPAGDLHDVLADLAGRGVRRLMVEGGSAVLAGFLDAGLADELQLAVAPLLVGDPRAPRFLGRPGRPRLLDLRAVGDAALLRYALSDRAS